jgi:DNA (cytosine-5)-methyltransferase 1
VTISGQDYQIVDIGLRMLTPRELFLAQGFPADYVIGDDASQSLTLTKTAQVRMCGNSVCPPLSEALVRANFAHEALIYGRAAA